jgi:hypothetical protein
MLEIIEGVGFRDDIKQETHAALSQRHQLLSIAHNRLESGGF